MPRSKQQDHAITLEASWRRAAATSAATVQEARRASSESARLVMRLWSYMQILQRLGLITHQTDGRPQAPWKPFMYRQLLQTV
jgi:hypothetical protein